MFKFINKKIIKFTNNFDRLNYVVSLIVKNIFRIKYILLFAAKIQIMINIKKKCIEL